MVKPPLDSIFEKLFYSDSSDLKTTMAEAFRKRSEERRKSTKVPTLISNYISEMHNQLMSDGIEGYNELYKKQDVLMLPRLDWFKFDAHVRLALEDKVHIHSPSNQIFSEKEFDSIFVEIFSKSYKHFILFSCKERLLEGVKSLYFVSMELNDHSDRLSNKQFKLYKKQIDETWVKSYHVFGSKTKIYKKGENCE